MSATQSAIVEKYGADPLQFGELRVPSGKGPFPVVVIIHGGCWTAGLADVHDLSPLAADLTRNHVATWNIEYRQVGNPGGGWPGTFLDWGAAVDHLRVLAKSHALDLSRVVVTGHSAGGHAALWLAARHALPKASEIRGADPLPVFASVDIDGPGDLIGFAGADAQMCNPLAAQRLVGGTPAEKADRFHQASPQELLPFGAPQFFICAQLLLPTKATEYQKIAQAKGDHVEILTLNAGHFQVIDPRNKAGQAVERLILNQALKPKSAK